MEYIVIPFVATIDRKKGNSNYVADQLDQHIQRYSTEGWDYVRLENVSTYIKPVAGCFGFGSEPGYFTSRQMIVFRRK